MNYKEIVSFLASNPWILACLSVLALWPLVKGLMLYGSRALSWFFDRVSIDRSETLLASNNINFLVSTLAWYALVLVTSTWMNGFLSSMSDGLRSVPQTTLITGLIWFNAMLQFLLGVLWGAIVANIGILSLGVRRIIKSKAGDDEK